MKKPVFTVFFLILSLVVGCSDTPPTGSGDTGSLLTQDQEINWVSSGYVYSDNPSKHELALLYFRSSDCAWGDSLEMKTFQDSSVIAVLTRQFDMVFMNTSSDSICAYFDTAYTANYFFKDIYHLVGVPSFLVLDKECKYVGRIRGYSPPDSFLVSLEQYTSSISK